MAVGQRDVRVWDLPTRLFHWVLVALVALQFATAEFHWLSMQWHYRFGYATLALLVFRIVWGFFGSQTSRFADFVRAPAEVWRYVKALATGRGESTVGHNALGGWSVLVMLVLLLTQTISGLFASDGIDTDGPFVDAANGATVKWMTRVHHLGETALLVVIALHIVAVLLHWLLHHDNLITPMISGRRDIDSARSLRFAGSWRAAILFLIVAAAVVLLSFCGN
jgi:cytochrome b